ncbi:MAG: stage II sporulation protein M, partial [Bacilli bacterium]|nr:stage II sporulation protein M [Bacilli bacterium]
MKNVKIVNELQKNKYKYIFLFTLIILGIITGIILSNIISYNDKKEIGDIIENYILNLKSNNLNYISNLINSLNVNFIYLLLIFICSISIIGIIINPLILYFKSFIIGFSIGIMINIYGYIGILIGIFSIFPHQIINIIIYLFLSFYGIKLSLH